MTTATRRKPPAPPKSPVTDYAERVVAGDIVAGRLVRLACQRHLDDLERAESDPDWGYWFDPNEAQIAIDFFATVLKLQEGEFAGEPFVLQPFQEFKTGALFGWKNADNYRRFRYAYIEEGKGNGKSPWAGGVGLLMLSADNEAGAEVYAAAVTRDQAKILFSDAEKMAEGSPDLSAELELTVNNIAHPSSKSFFRAISAEARALDGKRVHGALIDELHEHPSAVVVDKMRAGTKNRRQALVVSITNSGYDRNSVCYQHHVYSQQILEGIVENDEWFAYVCGLDACDEHSSAIAPGCPNCDDWTDEAVWPKVNPGLDTILPRKYLREQVAEAQGMPSKLNIVLRLNFCVWTESHTLWMPIDAWSACHVGYTREDMLGRLCFGGLDLARVRDLSAFVKVFPPATEDQKWRILSRFWCPEDGIRERVERDGVPYDVWVRDGLIETTPGNTTDFNFIEHAILEDSRVFDLREVPYDRTFAGEIVINLQEEGIKMVEFGQGFLSMASPTAELLRLVLAGELEHDGNAVMNWMMSNVVVRQDPAGNWKPDKDRSAEKIDGPVALIEGLGRAMVSDEGPSIYEKQGVEAW